MIRRATHSDKSIDDILQSIRNVINYRESENKLKVDLAEEEELHLTDIIPDQDIPEEVSLISKDARSRTEATLEDFLETAATLGVNHVESQIGDALKGVENPIEDFVIKLLKPQIKEWLDTNLPQMVKQIVAEEIKSLVANIQKNRS